MAGGTGLGVTSRWEALLHSCVPKHSLKTANLAHAALRPVSAQQGQVCPSWERLAGQEGRAAPTTPWPQAGPSLTGDSAASQAHFSLHCVFN